MLPCIMRPGMHRCIPLHPPASMHQQWRRSRANWRRSRRGTPPACTLPTAAQHCHAGSGGIRPQPCTNLCMPSSQGGQAGASNMMGTLSCMPPSQPQLARLPGSPSASAPVSAPCIHNYSLRMDTLDTCMPAGPQPALLLAPPPPPLYTRPGQQQPHSRLTAASQPRLTAAAWPQRW